MTTLTMHPDLSEAGHIRRIVDGMGHWQRMTMVMVAKQGFERSTQYRPGGEIGRLIDDQVLRHGTLKVDDRTQYVLLPGKRFVAVGVEMRKED